MKILLFENGEPGRVVSILGEAVQAEVEELLGGPVVLRRLTDKLRLARRKDETGVPWYVYRDAYGQWEPIKGPCAVLHVNDQLCAGHMSKEDLLRAAELVAPL